MSYLGSKGGSGVYQAIIAAMPRHEIYVEPMLGSGQILLRKTPAPLSIACDLNEDALRDFIDNADYDRSTTFISVCDAMDVLIFCRDRSSGVLIYFDPPYPDWTRTGFYRHNYGEFEWDFKKHCDFLMEIREHPANIMVSTYPNDLYREHLTVERGWRYIDFDTQTRGGRRTERLYMNFPAGNPHHHKYTGDNFTDRQRIKRKAGSWGRRFGEIENPGERMAILAAILATYDES